MNEASGEFEQQFEEFLESNRQKEELDNLFAVTKLRFETILGEKGGFGPGYEADSPLARVGVTHLTMLKLMEEASVEVIGEAKFLENDPYFKKHIQAGLLVQGYPKIWLDFVDEEFRGEPLTEQDDQLIAERLTSFLEASYETDFRLNQKADEMVNFLAGRGKSSLTEDELDTIGYLVAFHNIFSELGQPLSKELEDLRILLVSKGMFDNDWKALIEHFFADEPGAEPAS